MFRQYDEALTEFCTFRLADNQGGTQEVPKVFSTPDRAFARWAQLNPTKPDGSKRERDDVTLPMVSISRVGGAELDMTRFSMARNKVGFTSGFDGIFMAPHSDPYTLRYQVDIWTKRLRHMNAIQTQWLLRFNGDMRVISVPMYEEGSEYRELGLEIPPMVCEMFMEGIADNSDLEPGEDTNRIWRSSITVKLNAWLIKTATLVKTVRELHTQVLDADTGAEIERAEFDEDTLVVDGL